MQHEDSYNNELEGLVVLKRQPIEDSRGTFQRMYCAETLKEYGVCEPLSQTNLSYTRKRGVVRGMHFQVPPHAETKIVSCLFGEIYDTVVDLRQGSPTYLKKFGVALSADNGLTLVIPKGFAHGFQTMKSDCQVLYMHTASYQSDFEAGINPLDKTINIQWPLEVTEMSERDTTLPMLTNAFSGVAV